MLLDCGVAVSRPPSGMDVGDGGKAYYRVTPQATGCHAPAVNATSTSACHKDEPLLFRFFPLVVTDEFKLKRMEEKININFGDDPVHHSFILLIKILRQ